MTPDENVLVPIGQRGFCLQALQMHKVRYGHGFFRPEPGQSFVLNALYNIKGVRIENMVVNVRCLVEPDALTPCLQVLLTDESGDPLTLSLGSFLAADPQLVNNA